MNNTGSRNNNLNFEPITKFNIVINIDNLDNNDDYITVLRNLNVLRTMSHIGILSIINNPSTNIKLKDNFIASLNDSTEKDKLTKHIAQDVVNIKDIMEQLKNNTIYIHNKEDTTQTDKPETTQHSFISIINPKLRIYYDNIESLNNLLYALQTCFRKPKNSSTYRNSNYSEQYDSVFSSKSKVLLSVLLSLRHSSNSNNSNVKEKKALLLENILNNSLKPSNFETLTVGASGNKDNKVKFNGTDYKPKYTENTQPSNGSNVTDVNSIHTNASSGGGIKSKFRKMFTKGPRTKKLTPPKNPNYLPSTNYLTNNQNTEQQRINAMEEGKEKRKKQKKLDKKIGYYTKRVPSASGNESISGPTMIDYTKKLKDGTHIEENRIKNTTNNIIHERVNNKLIMHNNFNMRILLKPEQATYVNEQKYNLRFIYIDYEGLMLADFILFTDVGYPNKNTLKLYYLSSSKEYDRVMSGKFTHGNNYDDITKYKATKKQRLKDLQKRKLTSKKTSSRRNVTDESENQNNEQQKNRKILEHLIKNIPSYKKLESKLKQKKYFLKHKRIKDKLNSILNDESIEDTINEIFNHYIIHEFNNGILDQNKKYMYEYTTYNDFVLSYHGFEDYINECKRLAENYRSTKDAKIKNKIKLYKEYQELIDKIENYNNNKI